MTELQIFENPAFGEVRTIEEDGKVLFCGKDVATILGYKRPADAITFHCKGSVIRRLPTKGGEQNIKFITEGDIYRLAAKSELPGADKFESWIFDEVLPAIRKHGEYKHPRKAMTDYQKESLEIRKNQYKLKSVQLLTEMAKNYPGTTFQQVLHAYATRELTGEFLIPLPQLEAKTYSAQEIGDKLGISAHKVGLLANRNGLKTEQFGAWFNDKAKGHSKEVQSFRYYEAVIPELKKLLDGQGGQAQ